MKRSGLFLAFALASAAAMADPVDHRRERHSGAWQGFNASIERYIDDKLTVIVLMNLRPPDGRAAHVSSKIAALYLAVPAR